MSHRGFAKRGALALILFAFTAVTLWRHSALSRPANTNGTWTGVVEAGGQRLNLVLHVTTDSAGGLTGIGAGSRRAQPIEFSTIDSEIGAPLQ